MLEFTPFLISALSLGVIALMVFMVATVVLTIPVFATRGKTQVMWLLTSGFLLTVIGAVLVTLVVLTSQERIFQ